MPASMSDKINRSWSEILAYANVILRGVDVMKSLAANTLKAAPEVVLEMIQKIAESIQKADRGTITLAELHAELDKLRTQLAGNDAAIDSEIDKKFPT